MINFNLPEELIAQEPASPRDSARLLVYNRVTKKITDTVFSELPKSLTSHTTLVVNNSKVENCRWIFGNTEVFVIEKLDTHTIRAMVKPGRKFKVKKTFEFEDWLMIDTKAIDEDGIRTLKLNVQHDDSRLKQYEHIPLPPYIKQNDDLANEYQTVYADPPGSKAAPTAGLHFTDNLLKKIDKDHQISEVTLHVGLGTFAPLTEKNIKSGTLHEETYVIDSQNLAKINNAEHITAVGTTTVRTLESWKKLVKHLAVRKFS